MESRVRSRLVVFLFIAFVALLGVMFVRTFSGDGPGLRSTYTGRSLRILSYSSFVGSTGPGPELLQDFKALCNCEIEILTAGDAGLLLERLRLSKSAAPFDLVIGLDQLTLPAAEKELGWRDIMLEGVDWAPPVAKYVTPHFVPYDWAPLTFIYRKGEIDPPTSLRDLTAPRFAGKIAIQDPRVSSPGRQMLQWMVSSNTGSEEQYFDKLRPNIHSVSQSWSFSYGLFKKKQSALVFSYLTSLVYHWDVEGEDKYQAAVFADGHPYQVEFVAIPDFCKECELARDFVKFMLSKKGQDKIATKNFMMPAIATLPKSFQRLPQLKLVEPAKEADLHSWMNVFQE